MKKTMKNTGWIDTPSSSNIKRWIYETGAHGGTMLVTFKTGKTYAYVGVPSKEATRMVKAKSVGKFFCANIRDQFDSTLVK